MTEQNQISDLWVEKYRPKNLEDYVWLDDRLKNCVSNWLEEGQMPHLLLTGNPGTGKTSLALLMFKLLSVDPSDVLVINASSSRGIDVIRDSVTSFAMMVPVGKIKYVLLDEADMLTHAAQPTLRNIMETHAAYCRFILTANHSNKIIPALKSRCQHFHFKSLERDQFLKRLVEILVNEGAELSEDLVTTVEQYTSTCWPDLRKAINLLQQNWRHGALAPLDNTASAPEYAEIIDLVKNKKFVDARKLIASSLGSNDYTDFYRYLYENLDLFGSNPDTHQMVILGVAEGLKNHALVADPEINLTATLIKITQP
jgi:DNA polymerase III delta prime subunit